MKKNRMYISDAIPQRPASFDETVERTLALVCQNSQKEEKKEKQEKPVTRSWTVENGKERKRGAGSIIKRIGIGAVVAVFVVCTVGVSVMIALRSRSGITSPTSENNSQITIITPDAPKPQHIGKSYYLVNNVPVYPYESLLWESGSDYNVDGQSIEDKLAEEEIREKIPEAAYGAGLSFEILVQDGWTLSEIAVFSETYERIATVGSNELPLAEHGCANPNCVTTLSPGVYYVRALVENRSEQISRGNEIVIRLLVKEPDETPEPIENPPEQQSSAIPSVFRFWEYDEENGYREAPANGVLFRCDFDGDGTEEEIWYRLDNSNIEITVGGVSKSLAVGAEISHVILIDLDSNAAGLNLLVVCNFGSEDYETTELHLKNGKLKKGPTVVAYCEWDGTALRGSRTQTDILGTRFGTRTYHGADLTPDSEWFDCEHIPTESELQDDRETLMENGVLLHVRRDLPCTINGEDAVIPAGTYVYMTRWHESRTLAEIRTEDGTLTALVTVEGADPDDPEQYGYLIGGELQDTYFDNIFYAD